MAGKGTTVALLAFALLLLLGACSGGGASTGTVQGRFLMVGGPPPGYTEPTGGAVTATSTNGHKRVIHVGDSARFTVKLPTGRTTFVGYSPKYNSGHVSCVPKRPVIVKGNATVEVDVLCQMR